MATETPGGVLLTALPAARGGAGALVFLTGEPGIGKSRLAREVASQARAQAATEGISPGDIVRPAGAASSG